MSNKIKLVLRGFLKLDPIEQASFLHDVNKYSRMSAIEQLTFKAKVRREEREDSGRESSLVHLEMLHAHVAAGRICRHANTSVRSPLAVGWVEA